MQRDFPRGINLSNTVMIDGVSLAPGETIGVDANGKAARISISAVAGRELLDDQVGPLWHEYEFWTNPGQSNWAGSANTIEILDGSLDAPDVRAFAVIRDDAAANAINVATHWLPMVAGGDLQVARHPFQDSRDKTVCPKLAFMKRRLELFPGIKKIAVLPIAVWQTGFYVTLTGSFTADDIHWIPPYFPSPGDLGTALFNNAFAWAEEFLEKHPRFVLAGTLSEVGASEPPGTTKEAYKAALGAYLTKWRTLRGGDEAIHVHCSMPAPYRAPSPTLLDIHDAQQEFCAETERAVFCDLDSIAPVTGTPHYTPEGYRTMGRLAADASARVMRAHRARATPWVRMQYDADAAGYRDVYGSDVRVGGEVFATDGTRGEVLYANRQGFITDVQLPREEYTIALWVKRIASPLGEVDPPRPPDFNEVYVGGKLASQAFGFAFARTIAAHAELADLPADLGQAAFDLGLPAWDGVKTFENQPNPLLSSNWCHLALTYKNGTFAVYRNGASISAVAYTSGAFDTLPKDGRGVYPKPAGRYTMTIGTFGPALAQAPTCDMYFDDLCVLPSALTGAQVATLHSTGRLPDEL